MASHLRVDLEGIVNKRTDARYVPGRSPFWIKTTCHHRDTFAVVEGKGVRKDII